MYIDVSVKGFQDLVRSGILLNTVTGIIGEPGTGKSLLMQCMFLSPERGKRRYRLETYLVLSFKDDIQKLEKRIESVDHISGLVKDLKERNVELAYLHFTPGYVSPGLLLYQVGKLISEKKENERPITRVLVDDLMHMSQKYPLLSRQKMFVPTLMDMFNTENITVFVSCSTHAKVTQDIELQVRSVCDYILHARSIRKEKDGLRTVLLSVVKSFKRTHTNKEMQLVISNKDVVIQQFPELSETPQPPPKQETCCD